MGGLLTSLVETQKGILAVAKMINTHAEGLRTAKHHIETLCDQADLAGCDEAP